MQCAGGEREIRLGIRRRGKVLNAWSVQVNSRVYHGSTDLTATGSERRVLGVQMGVHGSMKQVPVGCLE